MTDAQHVFYIIASIALGLFAIFQIIAIIALLAIQRRIAKMSRRFHFVTNELYRLIESGKSYSRYVGASLTGSVIKGILRMFRRYYED